MNKVVCFFLALAFLGCPSPGRVFAYETIKIGALCNTTGAYASTERPALFGARLAVKEVNDGNGLLGKKIDLVHLDGRSNQTAIRDAMSEFAAEQQIVTVMGLSNPADASAAGFLAQKAGIPFVWVGADISSLPGRVGSCMYLVACDDRSQAFGLSRFVYQDLGARTGYVLIDASADDQQLRLADFFQRRFKRLAGLKAILLEDSFNSGDVDFTTQVQRLKTLDSAPDVLMVAAAGRDFIEIVKQFREAGIEQPIIGGERFGSSLLAEGGGAFIRNVYFSTQISFESERLQVRDFVEKYKEEYGHEPENALAALGYDAVHLIVAAIETAGNCKRKAIREALSETRGFEGVTGTIGYRDGMRVPMKSVSLMSVVDGKARFVKEITVR